MDEADNSEAWAKGTKGGVDVGSSDPQYHNNSKYYAQQAAEAAQTFSGGVVYRGSILFANLPTSDIRHGSMYNVTDDFTTDSRFSEGAGIFCLAGQNIIWNNDIGKWDLAARGGVSSFNGRYGSISPVAGDYTAAMVGAVPIETGKGLSTNDYTTAEKTKLSGIEAGAQVNVQSNWNQSDATADDFIKNKPALGTAALKDVPASGDASSSQVVLGNDTRLTAATLAKLGIVKPDGTTITINNGVLSAILAALSNSLKVQIRYGTNTYYTVGFDFNGGGEKVLQFCELPITVTSSGWSGSANSDGYYTNEVSLGMNVDLVTAIRPDILLKPMSTAAQTAAYRQICYPNGYTEVPEKGSTEWGIEGTVVFYAKKKPTVNFDVYLRGIFLTWWE